MFLGVCTSGFGASNITSAESYEYWLSYVSGHYFVGKQPPASIAAFPTTVIIDLETMVVINKDTYSEGYSMTINDVMAAVNQANDD